MKAMRDLRRFILAKCNSEEQHEIREYVTENLYELARDFCVAAGTITTALENVQDDASLAVRLLETIRRAESLQREQRKVNRAKAAQASAEALASMAKWQDGKVHVDMVSLLASALTKRNDLLVFTSDYFTVGVYMSPLFDLAKLRKKDLTAFVDSEGLHIRWKTGGLNLFSQADAEADRIVMSLRSMHAVKAA
jgi:hypothetical protein